MSRVGNAPIQLPAGTAVVENDGMVQVKGPKGELSQAVIKYTSIEVVDGVVSVKCADESRTARANHGLMRALLNNMVNGVSTGFSKQLEINGIGYRADVRGSNLVLNLGYSHQISFAIPKGINIAADKNNVVTVTGIDKQQVCQVAANIRGFRKPDAYKGKGVRYLGEYVRLKAGKSA
jgi:large subunit ribosomal protein L6